MSRNRRNYKIHCGPKKTSHRWCGTTNNLLDVQMLVILVVSIYNISSNKTFGCRVSPNLQHFYGWTFINFISWQAACKPPLAYGEETDVSGKFCTTSDALCYIDSPYFTFFSHIGLSSSHFKFWLCQDPNPKVKSITKICPKGQLHFLPLTMNVCFQKRYDCKVPSENMCLCV